MSSTAAKRLAQTHADLRLRNFATLSNYPPDSVSFRDLPNPDGTWEIDQPNSDEIYRSVYTYAVPRPHATTRIDEHLDNNQVRAREFIYDASGNQSGFVYHHSQTREID